jgi:catechol 2,3-dioxygenase-like lactoylglutathione lyase family enzyme
MIVGYNHTQMSVPSGNAEKVRDFYGRFLGMSEMPVPPALQGRGLIWFEVGNLQLHIAVEDGVNRLATGAHLAYEVDNLAELRRKLVDAGAEIFEQPKIEGFDRFHIRDPFGNRLELMQRV